MSEDNLWVCSCDECSDFRELIAQLESQLPEDEVRAFLRLRARKLRLQARQLAVKFDTLVTAECPCGIRRVMCEYHREVGENVLWDAKET